MVKKSLLGLLIIGTVCTGLIGCDTDTSSGVEANTGKYSSDYGLPAHEYNIYLAQEVNTVLNQLTTRMSNARLIAGETGDIEAEIVSVKYSIKVVEDCLTEIELLNPDETYKDEQDEAVVLINKVLQEFNRYKGLLEKNDFSSIQSSITRMSQYFTSLTAILNPVYQ